MPESPNKKTVGFEWRHLSELSDLLNRLGRHGFRSWPGSPEELHTELEILRLDPERDLTLLRADNVICGYALTLLEKDIDRLVASVASTTDCIPQAGELLDFILCRASTEEVSMVHIAVRGVPLEPIDLLKRQGFKPVTANLELTLERQEATNVTDSPLPDGFSLRQMRSSTETLLLTQVQNAVFEGHWGFSKNAPDEIQARLDLPITGPAHVLFVESPQGDVAGYIWTALEWFEGHTTGKIWMTGVMPAFRKAGIGRALVNAGIKHLFASGAADVQLEVIEDNTAAVHIYTQMGFERSGRTEWYEKRV